MLDNQQQNQQQDLVGMRVEASCAVEALPLPAQHVLALPEEDVITLYKALPHSHMVQLMFGEISRTENGAVHALYTLQIFKHALLNLDGVYPVSGQNKMACSSRMFMISVVALTNLSILHR